MNYNAKAGCQKCTVVGTHSYISNTVVFTNINQPPRTNEFFRANHYVEHQKVETPLTQLPINMIKDFVVADPLHLLELGVLKRLLCGWRTGDLGFKTKWSCRQQEEISGLLSQIKMPSEIHRDVRSLKLFSHWKGLEFRNFLNYYGPVVLKNYLAKEFYEHFLKLFCAVVICSAEKYLCHLNVAKLLFEQFITDYKRLYGAQFITSNVHNLDHVVDDVSRFGILSSISAYPFESCLFSIKRMIRAGKNPLVQIANRMTERLFISSFNNMDSTYKGPTIQRGKNNKCEIEFLDFKLSNVKFKDMWFYANKNIFKMENAFEENSNFFIEGFEVLACNDFFVKPFKSSLLSIFIANVSNIERVPLKRVNVCDIECKFVVINHSIENTYVFIPLLHTIKK